MAGTGSTEPAVAAARDVQRRPGETVLITGVSSGIGPELARLFAGDGAELVLVARGEGRLRELAGELTAEYAVQARVVPADLSQPASLVCVFRGSPPQFDRSPADGDASREPSGMGSLRGSGTMGP